MNQCNFDNEYLGMKNTVCRLQVVNDTAERSIKDIQEYAKCGKRWGEERKKSYYYLSQIHNVKLPNFQKNEMEEHL